MNKLLLIFLGVSVFISGCASNHLNPARSVSIVESQDRGKIFGMGTPNIVSGYVGGYVEVTSSPIEFVMNQDCKLDKHEWKFTDLSGHKIGPDNVGDNKGFLITQKFTASGTCNYIPHIKILAKGRPVGIDDSRIDGRKYFFDPYLNDGDSYVIIIPTKTFHHSLEYTIKVAPEN